MMKIKELSLEKLGIVLLQVTPAAAHAHHKWVKSTIKDYMLPGKDQLELEFIRDLFTLTTEEIADKWYDGEENAIGLIM
jgi:hypothetical protein